MYKILLINNDASFKKLLNINLSKEIYSIDNCNNFYHIKKLLPKYHLILVNYNHANLFKEINKRDIFEKFLFIKLNKTNFEIFSSKETKFIFNYQEDITTKNFKNIEYILKLYITLLNNVTILDTKKIFSIRLKEKRLHNNLSQTALAKIFGLKRTTISSYERAINEPHLDLLVKMANYFNTSVDYLLGKI